MDLEYKKWFPLVVLLILILSLVVYLFVFKFGADEERFASEPIVGCVVMSDRGHYEDSVDIVFLSENYDDMSKFILDTNEFKESMMNVDPYSAYSKRFNFFRLESFENLGCKYDGEYEGAVVCDPTTVKKAASGCPADYYIVLVDVNGVKNFFDHLRSSAWRGVASLNTADDALVFSHEFAHLFAGLHDEYTWEGGKISGDSPNCDKEFNSCPKFGIVKDSGCFVGCVNNEHSRSVDVGIMRDYWKSDSYGAFNEYLIEKVILKNSLSNSEIGTISKSPKLIPAEETLLVEYECESSNCRISSVSESEGYVQRYIDTLSGEHIMSLELSNGDSYNFDYSNILYIEGPDLDGRMVADHRKVGKVRDFLVVKSPKGDTKIEIKNAEGIVLDTYDYVYSSDNSQSYSSAFGSKFVDVQEVV